MPLVTRHPRVVRPQPAGGDTSTFYNLLDVLERCALALPHTRHAHPPSSHRAHTDRLAPRVLPQIAAAVVVVAAAAAATSSSGESAHA